MKIDCGKPQNVLAKPRPIASSDGRSYHLSFPIPAARVRWLKVYLEERHLVVRAQLSRDGGSVSGEEARPDVSYEQSVALPSDVRRQAFLPLFEEGHLKLTLLRQMPQAALA